MREEFEKLPEVHEKIKDLHPTIIWFCDQENKYASSFEGFQNIVIWLNGAYYAYQEQQKKIDDLNMKLEATKCVSSKRREEVLCRDSKINAAKKEINDFFDNQTMTPSPREYANKLADVLELLK